MPDCEQANPPQLSISAANPQTLSCGKSKPHYLQCVLIPVTNERGEEGSVKGGGKRVL